MKSPRLTSMIRTLALSALAAMTFATVALGASKPIPIVDARTGQAVDDTPAPLRSVNIQSDPFLYLVRGANLGFQFGVTSRLTVGPTFTYLFTGWNKDLPGSSASAYDLQANYWLTSDRFTRGAFIRGYVGRSDTTTVKYTSVSTGTVYGASKVPATDIAALGGYHFTGFGGFNVEVAGGVGYQWYDSVSTEISDTGGLSLDSGRRSRVGLRLSARAGWSF